MTAPTLTRETVLEAAERIDPLIRAHADEGERNRRLSMPVVEAMRDAGFFRMVVPASLGGRESDPMGFFRLIERIGRADGSAAWCLFIGGGSAVTGMFMPDETAEEVYGDSKTIMAGSTFPPGKAVATDGGYNLSGRWGFASGCQHATWHLALAMAFDGDAPRMGPAGPEMRVAVLPVGEATILDTWDVSGLSGTGSHDFTLENHFVPERRAFALRPGAHGSHYQGPLYRLPFFTTFGFTIAAVALGIAQGAVDSSTELATKKVPRGSDATLQNRSLFQYAYADAVATMCASRSWLYEELGRAWAQANEGKPFGIEDRGRLWLAACNAVRGSAHTVDAMYTHGGSTSNYRKSNLQRAMRDIHAVTQHVATSPQSMESAGKMLLGMPSANPLVAL